MQLRPSSMKLSITLFTLLLFSGSGFSQDSLALTKAYDFWIGEWDLEWDDGNGEIGLGTNSIKRVLAGSVIEENFVSKDGNLAGYLGRSLSVFNPNTTAWSQTWVDNQGGYIPFDGDVNKDGNRVFKTKSRIVNEATVISRMVFYDITEDSLTWDWETTNDDGKTWILNWKIKYSRSGIRSVDK